MMRQNKSGGLLKLRNLRIASFVFGYVPISVRSCPEAGLLSEHIQANHSGRFVSQRQCSLRGEGRLLERYTGDLNTVPLRCSRSRAQCPMLTLGDRDLWRRTMPIITS